MTASKDHQGHALSPDYSLSRRADGGGSVNVWETLKITDSECAELMEKLNSAEVDQMNERTKLLLKKLTETLKILNRSMTDEAESAYTVISKVEEALHDVKSDQFEEKDMKDFEQALATYRTQLKHKKRKSRIDIDKNKNINKPSKIAKRQNLEKLRKKMRQKFLDAKMEDGSEPTLITRPAYGSERMIEDNKTEPIYEENHAMLKCRSNTDNNSSNTRLVYEKNIDATKASILDVNDVDLSLAERLRNPDAIMTASQLEDIRAELSSLTAETPAPTGHRVKSENPAALARYILYFSLVFIVLYFCLRLAASIFDSTLVPLSDCSTANHLCQNNFKCCFRSCGATRWRVFWSKMAGPVGQEIPTKE